MMTMEEALIAYELMFGPIDVNSSHWLPHEEEFLFNLIQAVYEERHLHSTGTFHYELCLASWKRRPASQLPIE